MYTILIVLGIIVSILLVFVVLIQNSNGGGLAANFAAGNQIFGVRQTADTLEKATWYLSITLGFICILTTTVFQPSRSSATGGESTVQRNSELFNTPTPAAQPGFSVDQPAQGTDQQQTTTQEQQNTQNQEQQAQ
jgi:preprotein translocase subunit SecG